MEVVFLIITIVALSFLLTAFIGAPYVPTLGGVKKDLYTKLLAIKKTDVVVDLGCGDGTILVDAARYGARTIGYEINPLLVVIAWLRLRRFNGAVRLADMWRLEQLPPGTTIVYYFGAARDVPKLKRCLLRWGKGYRLVSFGFEISGLKEIARHKALHIYEV